jgi:hypothetical protein
MGHNTDPNLPFDQVLSEDHRALMTRQLVDDNKWRDNRN